MIMNFLPIIMNSISIFINVNINISINSKKSNDIISISEGDARDIMTLPMGTKILILHSND